MHMRALVTMLHTCCAADMLRVPCSAGHALLTWTSTAKQAQHMWGHLDASPEKRRLGVKTAAAPQLSDCSTGQTSGQVHQQDSASGARTGGKEESGARAARVGGGLCSLCMACTANGSPL